MNEKVRLGYACVNMTLTNRPKKLGGRVTTSRGARKGWLKLCASKCIRFGWPFFL